VRLLVPALAAGWALCACLPAWGASRTIDIIFTSMTKTDGEIRGTESYTGTERESLVALKRAGDPALADCLFDAWETHKMLVDMGLTVREISTTITKNRYELNWHADFARLPAGIGPLTSLVLEPAAGKTNEYQFSGVIGLAQGPAASRGTPPLGGYALTVNVRFPGTVSPKVTGSGVIDHTGELVSWKTDLGTLRTKSIPVSATVTPGRATESRYWLALMVTLTVLVGVIMLGVLRRGAGNAKQP
jgi:hypothetical protein